MGIRYHEVHNAVTRIVGSFPFFTGENSLLADSTGSGNLAIELCVEESLDFHSTIEPRVLLSDPIDVPHGERRRYFLVDPDEVDSPVEHWDPNFSQPLGVIIVPDDLEDDEDPRDLTLWNNPPLNLAKFINYELVQFDDNEYLEIKNHINTLSPDDRLLIRYSGRHKFEGEGPANANQIGSSANDPRTLTIKGSRKTAITYLSTSLIMQMAAVRAEKANDPASGLEFVTMRTKASGFKKISDFYKDKYEKEVGIDGVAGASSSIPMSPLNALNLTQVFANRISVLQSSGQVNRSLNR